MTLKKSKKVLHMSIVIILLVVFIALIIYAVRSFLFGNYINSLWLLVVIFSWMFPSIRERFVQAIHYIKRKIKK